MLLTRGSKFCCLLFLSLFLLTPVQVLAQQTAVHSELSSDTITRDESVTLTITAIGLDGELDASSLGKDFEVVGRSSSRQISSIRGSDNKPVATSVVTWALELLPKDVGVFTVPSVSVRGQESELLTLTVNELPTGAKRDVFVTAVVDTQTPWVQSEVTMTLKVYQAIDIVDGGLDVPSGNDLVVERIGEDSRKAEIIDGRQYSITERRFAIFPQKSGSATVEPITLSVSIPADPSRVRGFFSPTRKLTRRTDPITLNVKARPPNGSAWWLPARKVELERTWSGDPNAAEVDQPLTRSIVLRASGVLDSQLPDISIPAIEGLSLYAEQPARARGANETGLVAEHRINWAIIPQRTGELILPAINVEWFNTQTGKNETAVLAEESITVTASNSATSTGDAQDMTPTDSALLSRADSNAGNLASPVVLTDSQPLDPKALTLPTKPVSDQIAALEAASNTWRYATFAALALWLATLMGFLIRQFNKPQNIAAYPRFNRRRGHEADSNNRASLYSRIAPLAAVEASCKSGDLSSVRNSLLEWSSRQWADNVPLTLNAIVQKLPKGDAQTLVRQLDNALYNKPVDGVSNNAIVDLLKELPVKLRMAMSVEKTDSAVAEKSPDSLPPL